MFTGDFVKTNGLQEGDFIVIYSDVKCGKYVRRNTTFIFFIFHNIQIYQIFVSIIKSRNYLILWQLIRGVKVRQPAGQKPEAPSSSAAVTKRQSKSQRSINNNSPSANIVASPTSQAVK